MIPSSEDFVSQELLPREHSCKEACSFFGGDALSEMGISRSWAAIKGCTKLYRVYRVFSQSCTKFCTPGQGYIQFTWVPLGYGPQQMHAQIPHDVAVPTGRLHLKCSGFITDHEPTCRPPN